MSKRTTQRQIGLTAYILFLVVMVILPACAANPSGEEMLENEQMSKVWVGSGIDQSGVPFEVQLFVRENKLTGVSYKFVGKDGLPCNGIQFGVIDKNQQPDIENGKVSAKLGKELTVEAKFLPDQNIEGVLDIYWSGHQRGCNGNFEVIFNAQPQVEQVQIEAPAERNPNASNSLEIFIQIVVFGLSNGAVLALNAIGVTIIYGTVRSMNLAHGDVFALTTALVTSTINLIGVQKDWAPFQIAAALLFVFIAAVLAGSILSLGVERFGFAPFRGKSTLAPVIATLGLSFMLFQLALVWRVFQGSWISGEHRSVPGLPEVPTDGIPSFLPEINLIKTFNLPFNLVVRFSDVFVILAAALLVFFANWIMQKTKTGRAIRAVSQIPGMAQMLGINVNAIIRRAFALGGAFAGAAGFIFAIYYGRPFGSHGAQSGLFAFMAALLGGIGDPVGALFSSLAMGVFSALSDYYFAAQWTPVLLLATLLVFFIFKPSNFYAFDPDSASTRDSIISISTPRSANLYLQTLSILALALVPFFFKSGLVVMQTVGIFIVLALGLNISLGFAGLLDFGFAASFGIGAYLTALFTDDQNMFVVIASAAMAGAALGWIKGLFASKLRSDFFAVATLAFGLLIRQFVINLDMTGGMGGLGSIRSLHFLDLSLYAPTGKYFLVLGVVIIAIWLSNRLAVSRTGRSWLALSEDEAAAVASGVNISRAKTYALMIGSALAGVAGALYATSLAFVEPDMMAFHISSMILSMVILGGAGNVTGAIFGAAAIILYDKVFIPQIGNFIAYLFPFAVGSVPDMRGASFFNFGIAIYITVLIRAGWKQWR